MAISWVQSATPGVNAGGSTNTTVTGTFASSNTVHNAIIVGVAIDNTATSAITDNAGNTYTKIATQPSTGNFFAQIWACMDIKAASGNFITDTQGFNDSVVFAQEFSGLATASATDQITGGQVISTANSLPSITTGVTTTADELVVMIAEMDIFSSNSLTVGTGYSNFQTGSSSFIIGGFESKVVAATGAQTATMSGVNTGGASWRGIVVTFKAAAAAAAGPIGKLFGTETSPSTTTLQAVMRAATR